MKYLDLTDGESPNVAVLVKESAFSKTAIQQHYVRERKDVITVSLKYNENNKAPVKLIKEYLGSILPSIKQLGVTTLLVADANYFKVLTNKRKAEPELGHICNCVIKDYEDLKVILTINHQSIFYNPANEEKLNLSLFTLDSNITAIGSNIIRKSSYPSTHAEIVGTLKSLHQYKALTCDIETYGLALDKADIGSIAFAWNKHEGTAFLVDDGIKPLLREFFSAYKGKLIYHNASFDIRNIIYRCFMRSSLDIKGLLQGLHTMYQDVEDTKLITYLATNSTAGNDLSLKSNAHEFAGNYAQENINDITQIPTKELLEYNLIDCLATWYVHEKYYNQMVKDNQLDIYRNLFIPSLKVITQMELTGMPMDMDAIDKAATDMTAVYNRHVFRLRQSKYVKEVERKIQQIKFIEKNKALKKKIKPLSDFVQVFNPNSNQQVTKLLYEVLELPIIDTTDKGAPSTSGDTLQKLYNKLIQEYEIDESKL